MEHPREKNQPSTASFAEPEVPLTEVLIEVLTETQKICVNQNETKYDIEHPSNKTDDGKKKHDNIFQRIRFLERILTCRSFTLYLYQNHKICFRRTLYLILVVLYFVYFAFAVRHSFGDEGSLRLVVVTCLVCIVWTYIQLKKLYGKRLYVRCCKPLHRSTQQYKHILKRIAVSLTVILVITFTIVDVILRRPYHLISAVGILLFIFSMFITSHDPSVIRWRTVLWGIILQFIFALIVLRTSWGYNAFNWMASRVIDYLSFTDAGAEFVFGEQFRHHFFAFRVLATIVFFSSTISILYYLGWMQVFIEKIVWVMMYSMGTGAMESLHAAVNVFVGWGESTMIIQPILDKMTTAEIHAIMTNGFATVAGSTLGVYILYGAPANHLISASFLSAPAALAMTKLAFPDKLEDMANKKKIPHIPSTNRSIMEAASSGAVASMTLIGHILVNVIAFVSLLGFINGVLLWFGERIGLKPPDYAPLTFQFICSYLFWPVVFMMGVPLTDCRIVARMVGVKVFVNEFIAYKDLGIVIRNRNILNHYNGTWHWTNTDDIVFNNNNVTLIGGVLSPRSEMIATYALCGFSNLVALGIMVAALCLIAPSRKYDIIKCGPRALVSGCMACFITACMAGFVGDEI